MVTSLDAFNHRLLWSFINAYSNDNACNYTKQGDSKYTLYKNKIKIKPRRFEEKKSL